MIVDIQTKYFRKYFSMLKSILVLYELLLKVYLEKGYIAFKGTITFKQS